MELKVVVSLAALAGNLIHSCQSPAIQLLQLIIRYRVGIRVEVVQVTQDIAGGVADFSVYLAELLEDVVGNTDVGMVVGGSNPQTQDVCTEFIGDLRWVDTVAQRFVHCFALCVHYPAVGANCLVRSNALPCNRGQQRGLEPAAVLVSALQVQVSRPSQVWSFHQHCCVAGTGVKPNVHDVGFFSEFFASALFTFGSLWKDFLSFMGPPCIRAFFAEQVGNCFDRLLVDVEFSTFFAVEDWNWNTPQSLTGDTPVGAVGDHVLDAAFTPSRNPFNLFDFTDCIFFEILHRAEPLFGCTVDDWVFTSPAVWVLMDNLFNRKQQVAVLQLFRNRFVGFIGGQTLKFACILGQLADVVHRHNDWNLRIVVDTNLKVLYTMSRRGMYTTGTGIQCDVVTDDDQRVTVEERMRTHDVLQILALDRTNQLVILNLCCLHCSVCQFFCHDVVFTVCMNCAVFIIRTQTYCHIARQGPGSGSPDNKEGLCRVHTQCAQLALVVLDREFDVDGEAWVLLVFNLCLCQRSVAVRAPVNRFQTLVDITLLCHVAENFNLLCLKFRLEGHVRIFPLAQSTQTLKLCALGIQIMQSKLLANLSQLDRTDVAGNACLLSGFQLDWQTVGIPTRDVRSLVSAHVLLTDDEILEHLVQSSAKMDVTVCIWRTVVQNVLRLALVLFDHLVV